jgi:quercetin dioxygenase-like cupin family protein
VADRHHVLRAFDVRLSPCRRDESEGYTRCSLVDASVGSVHMGLGRCALEPGGCIDVHVHAFEESFYVLDGTLGLVLDGCTYRLKRDSGGIVPVGVPHAWVELDGEPATWIEMLAPQPREEGRPSDTLFLGRPSPDRTEVEVDVRNPLLRQFFELDGSEMVLDNLKKGVPVDAPAVSASMATALLAYSGIALKMLVDQRLGAELSTMFMVEYQPGGVAQPHDHPFEEAYVVLDGEVEAVADGIRYVLYPGDVLWTGVGCIHAFYNTSDRMVRWLETQAPQPPARHSYRFERDWDYLRAKLQTEPAAIESSAGTTRPDACRPLISSAIESSPTSGG